MKLRRLKRFISFGWLFFFLTLFGRGLIGDVTGKPLAYLVQILVVTVYLLYLTRLRIRIDVGKDWLYVAVILSAFLSMLLSYNNVGEGIFYFFPLIAFTAFINFASVKITALSRYDDSFRRTLIVVGIILFLAASLQQLGYMEFSEDSDSTIGSVIRPSSLTGSYLHYPIVMALIFFICCERCAKGRFNGQFVIASVFLVAVAASFSRSGMFIVLAGFGIWIIFHYKYRSIPIVLGFVCLFVFAIATENIFVDKGGIISEFVSRYLLAVDLGSAGNEERAAAWMLGIEAWIKGAVVLGSQFGLFNNISGNLGGKHVGVVESGVLEMLTAMGAIGTALYYGMWVRIGSLISPAHKWLRAGFIAALLEGLFYQSIEIIPFIVTLSLFPVFSKYLQAPPVFSAKRGPMVPAGGEPSVAET